LKFGQEKLEKAKKRNATDAELAIESGKSCDPKCIYPLRHSLDKEKCKESNGKLHQLSTLEADSTIHAIAKDLEDTSLIVKIEGGDLITLESKCHLDCLTKLRNHHRSYLRENRENSDALIKERKMEARALLNFWHIKKRCNLLFKFLELRALYERRLSFWHS